LKILIITPRVPYPPFRGDKLKIYNISRLLKENNEVSIVTFLSGRKEIGYIEELKKSGITVEYVRLPLIKSAFNLFRALIPAQPFQVAYYNSRLMKEKISGMTSREKFDAAYFHLIRSAQYADSIRNPETLKVIDFTDAVSLYLSRYIDVLKNGIKKALIKLELRKIVKYEDTVKNFDTLFVCSDADKEFLNERNVHSNIKLLYNGIDVDAFRYEKKETEKNRIIFTGNMPYFANKDAVLYFAKDVFPGVVKSVPDAKFYIVGQNPPSAIKKLHSGNIIVTGFVPDIKTEYLKSEVNVAPIRFGAGTLNKIIEALALGVPTVATSLSIEGFPEELKKYVFTADTAEEFAKQIVYILNNPGIRSGLMAEASEKVRETLSWKRIVGDFELYLKSRIKNNL